MATPQRPRNGGSSESVHLTVGGASRHISGESPSRPSSLKGSIKAGGDMTTTATTTATTTLSSEGPDSFGDLLYGTVPEDDEVFKFPQPGPSQQVTVQHNHQRQESQRVLARSPSPPRVKTPTQTTLQQRTSMSLKGSQSSIAMPHHHALSPPPQPSPQPFNAAFSLRKPGTESTQVHTYYILTLRDSDACSETSTTPSSKHNSSSSSSSSSSTAVPGPSTRTRSAMTTRKRARLESATMETVDEETTLPELDYVWWCIDVPYSENSKMEPLEVVKVFQRLPNDMKNAVIRMETELETMGTDKSVIKWINYDKEAKSLSIRYLQNAREVDSSTWD